MEFRIPGLEVFLPWRFVFAGAACWAAACVLLWVLTSESEVG